MRFVLPTIILLSCASVAQQRPIEPSPADMSQSRGTSMSHTTNASEYQHLLHRSNNAPSSTFFHYLQQGLPVVTGTDSGVNWWRTQTLLDSKDYTAARQQLQQLMQMGNYLASAKLAELTEQGLGQTSDPILALAYYQLAQKMQPNFSTSAMTALSGSLDAAQLSQAEILTGQLAASIKIQTWTFNQRATPRLIPDSKNTLVLGRRERTKAFFGHTTVISLVNTKGEPLWVEAVGAIPANNFESATIRQAQRSRYEPGETIGLTRRHTAIPQGAGLHTASFQQLIDRHQLWQGATQGDVFAQYQLANLLTLAELQAGAQRLVFDSAASADRTQPDFMLFNRAYENYAYFAEPVNAQFSLSEQGEVQSTQLTTVQLASVKQQLGHNPPPGSYRLYTSNLGMKSKNAVIEWLNPLPATLSSTYWFQRAAESGFEPAQKQMALLFNYWESYVAEQGTEPLITALYGVRRYNEGHSAEGLALLQQAEAAGFSAAKQFRGWLTSNHKQQ